jgi:uncharacterized OB-fold protein
MTTAPSSHDEQARPARYPEFAPFRAGLLRHELQFPFCRQCERFHWYPMQRCPHCQNPDYDWQVITSPGHTAAQGHVFSWTTVRHPFSPEWRERVPYIVALLEFDAVPGVRLISNLIDVEPDDVTIGMAVHPVFLLTEPEHPKVVFQPLSI